MSAKSRGSRRLMQELAEMELEAESGKPLDFHAAPLEGDLFHWHFTIRLKNDEFAGGIYHGRVLLPPEYPLRPPEVYLLTPSGRFETNTRICLSITGFHEDTWQPAWGIRTALVSLSAFFSTEAKGAIAGLDTPPAERRRLAKLSTDWVCPVCKTSNAEILSPRPGTDDSNANAPDVDAGNAESHATSTAEPSHAALGDDQPAKSPQNLVIESSDVNATPVAVALRPQNLSSPPVPIAASASTAATRIAGPIAKAPPTLLDRLIVLLLVALIGFVARAL